MVLDFCTKVRKQPRLGYSEFHRKYSHYSRKQNTIYILNKAYENIVLSGPFLYCNSGIEVTLFDDVKNPIRFLQKIKNDGKTTYAIALCGDWDFISFNYGASILEHACTITPTCLRENKYEVENLTFEKEGKLKGDPYPKCWDELDWQVYETMDCPRKVSFRDAGEELGVSWVTVKSHFKKILNQCKILTCFFPLGYYGYQQIFLTFKTKYEIGVVNALKKLDRTTYLWKFNDTIILNLFLLPDALSYNRASDRFQELEEMGIIHDLHVSVPIRCHNTFYRSK